MMNMLDNLDTTNEENDISKYPKISIVTPSYNQGQYLEQTIKSVLDQKYPNLEYIIIDGGSSDDSIKIIKKYEKQITYWVSEPDLGQTNALNKGFNLATGKIFGYINSDDFYLENAFNNAISSFNELNCDVVIGNTIRIPANEIVYAKQFEFDLVKQINSFDLTPPQQSAFWKSSKHIKFDEKFNYVFDRLFFMQAISRNYTFNTINQDMGVFRIHGLSKTTLDDYRFDLENYKVNILLINELPIPKLVKSRLIKRQNLLLTKIQLHRLSIFSSKGLALLYKTILIKPLFLLSREFLGKLKKDAFKKHNNQK